MPDISGPKSLGQTAKIRDGVYCASCGWPIVSAFCNDDMARVSPYSGWDNWIYCTNKTCQHHVGEGVFHNMPGWIKTTGR